MAAREEALEPAQMEDQLEGPDTVPPGERQIEDGAEEEEDALPREEEQEEGNAPEGGRQPREGVGLEALSEVSFVRRFDGERRRGPVAQASGAGKDLSKELLTDAKNLIAAVSWSMYSRLLLTFTGSIALGAVVGVIIGLLSGVLKAEDSSGVPLGGMLIFVSVCCLVAAIAPAVCLVHDLLTNLQSIGGEMLNFAIARLGVDMLVRISELEKNATLTDGVVWVLNLTNPSQDALELTRIFFLVSMNDSAFVLFKSQPLPSQIPGGAAGAVPLEVEPRPPNRTRAAFQGLTRGNRWAVSFAKEVFDLSIEGRFRGKDFTVQALATLPIRLADLPMPATWPIGLDVGTVERAYTAGLANLHSTSGSLFSLPSKSNYILDYEGLTVEGPLQTWFTWMMFLCTALATPFSTCLALGGLKVAGGAGKPTKAGEDSRGKPADAASDSGAGAAASGNAAAPAATPAPAAAPAPEQAESAPSPTRSARAHRAPQAKAAPAPAPAAGGDDEHEF